MTTNFKHSNKNNRLYTTNQVNRGVQEKVKMRGNKENIGRVKEENNQSQRKKHS